MKDAAMGEAIATASTNEAQNGSGPASAQTETAAKSAPAAAKPARKRAVASFRKTAATAAAPTKPRKPAGKKKPTPAENAVSDDDIRMRAYFIAEWRTKNGIAGDSASDWMEARRQLMQEAAGRA